MKKIASLAIALLAIASCSNNTEETTAKTKVAKDTLGQLTMNITNCSRLYTSECKIHKIVAFDDKKQMQCSVFGSKMSIGAGDRKIAIPMDVVVKAYIDFSGFSSKNITRDSGKICIELPDPKITVTSSSIDHAGIRQYATGLRSSEFSEEEKQKCVQQGMDDVIKKLPTMDLIEHAKVSAVRLLNPMIAQWGYKEDDITIRFKSGIADKNLSKDSPLINIEQAKD